MMEENKFVCHVCRQENTYNPANYLPEIFIFESRGFGKMVKKTKWALIDCSNPSCKQTNRVKIEYMANED